MLNTQLTRRRRDQHGFGFRYPISGAASRTYVPLSNQRPALPPPPGELTNRAMKTKRPQTTDNAEGQKGSATAVHL